VSAAVSVSLGLWRHRHLQGNVGRLSHRRQCDLDQEAAFYLNPDPGSQINPNPSGSGSWSDFKAVLRIRIRFRIHRIHMCLGLLDPDPLVRGIDPDPDPDPSIIMQK
jgi:hypothetical protein